MGSNPRLRYRGAMTDTERLDALLALADPEKPTPREAAERLVVLGLAEQHRKNFRPTSAGWNLLGERGRPFLPW